MSFEENLVNQINEFRANPAEYAKKLNGLIKNFKGKTYREPGSNVNYRTKEGAEAYIEAIDYLSKLEGTKPFIPSKGLSRICQDFLDLASKVDPSEINNINLDDIIAKYGEYNGELSTLMDFGSENPEQVLLNLVICDGNPDRVNRNALLGNNFTKIGVATGKHPTYQYNTYIILCTEFNNTFDKNDKGFINSEPEEEIVEQPIGKTLRPKKVVLKESAPPKVKATPPSTHTPSKNTFSITDDEIPPEDVVSIEKVERMIIEKGKKVKVIKTVTIKVDGTKETKIVKEKAEDDQ